MGDLVLAGISFAGLCLYIPTASFATVRFGRAFRRMCNAYSTNTMQHRACVHDGVGDVAAGIIWPLMLLGFGLWYFGSSLARIGTKVDTMIPEIPKEKADQHYIKVLESETLGTTPRLNDWGPM